MHTMQLIRASHRRVQGHHNDVIAEVILTARTVIWGLLCISIAHRCVDLLGAGIIPRTVTTMFQTKRCPIFQFGSWSARRSSCGSSSKRPSTCELALTAMKLRRAGARSPVAGKTKVLRFLLLCSCKQDDHREHRLCEVWHHPVRQSSTVMQTAWPGGVTPN